MPLPNGIIQIVMPEMRPFLKNFSEINEAYEVLSDPTQRAQYDRLGAFYQLEQSVPTPEELGSFVSETIGNIFFEDIIVPVQVVTLHTLYIWNCPKSLEAAKPSLYCEKFNVRLCGGLETADSTAMETCTECDGTGKRSRFFRSPCPRCDGRGYLITKRCRQCAGIGLVDKSDEIFSHSSRNPVFGQLIQIKSKGNASSGNKGNGNLILVVQIKDSPTFGTSWSRLVL